MGQKDLSDGYINGLDRLVFNGTEFGMIDEDGLTPGGSSASKTQLRGAQVRNAVVKTLITTPSTKSFTFNLIELKTDNIAAAMGGTVDDKGIYSAPAGDPVLEGPARIECASGHIIEIAKASLTSSLANGVNLAKSLAIQCEMEIETPADKSAPFKVIPPGVEASISALPESLQFTAAGGTQIVSVKSSGIFTVGDVPEGFSVKRDGNNLQITADENISGIDIAKSLDVSLVNDPTTKVTIALNVSK